MRSLLVGLLGALAALASAQFDGPAPVAWRWTPPSGVASTGKPLVNGENLIVACGGRLYAVDRSTGNKEWQFPSEEPIRGVFPTAPILANGVLVAVGDNKIAYGIDPQTGQEKWSYVMPTRAIMEPVLADKYVVVEQSDNTLIAIDPTDGTPAWKNPDTKEMDPYHINDGLYGQIASVGSNVLYFTSSSQMHCLSVATRLEQWPMPLRFSQLSPVAKPIVYGETVFVASGPFLVAINPASGTALWQQPTGFGDIPFNPAPSSVGIFVVSDDGQAMLFDLASGRPTSLMPRPVALGSYPAADPTSVGSKFIIPTSSGAIDLFDPASQSILWSYVVRPIDEGQPNQNRSSRMPGGQGPGGGRPGGAGGGQTGNRSNQPITEVVAAGPAVMDGTTLIVPEQDSSLIAFDSQLGVDLTPPKTEMLFPNPGDQVSGLPPLLLYFKIRDWGSGVNEKTLKITIDGRTYDYEYRHDGSCLVLFNEKNRPLADGRHDILVDVSDWMGNEAKQHFSLTIDNTLAPIVIPGQEPNQNQNRGGGAGGGAGGGGGGAGGGGAGGG